MTRRENPICQLCPQTMCMDYGNGYMSSQDLETGKTDYLEGSIHRCPLREKWNDQGYYCDDDGRVYMEFRSVRDIIEDAKGIQPINLIQLMAEHPEFTRPEDKQAYAIVTIIDKLNELISLFNKDMLYRSEEDKPS